ILLLGVLATLLALVHEQWSNPALHWAVVTVPILISVLIALANRRAAGKRWVLLRAAAEATKTEIYRYRTRTGGYPHPPPPPPPRPPSPTRPRPPCGPPPSTCPGPAPRSRRWPGSSRRSARSSSTPRPAAGRSPRTTGRCHLRCTVPTAPTTGSAGWTAAG